MFSDTNPKHADSDNVLLAKIAQAVTSGGSGGISEIPEPLPVQELQIVDAGEVAKVSMAYSSGFGGVFVISELDGPSAILSYAFATGMLTIEDLTISGALTFTTPPTINGVNFTGGAIVIPPYAIDTHSTLTYAATTNIDFTAANFRTETLTGNVTFTTSNLAAGRSVTIRIIGDSSTRTLTFPAWKFVGAAAPASLAANKVAILTITSFGATDANCIAAYSAEP